MKIIKDYPNVLLFAVLVVILLVSLTLGRYPMSLMEIFQAVKASLTGAEITDRQDEILFLLRDIRLPRILAAVLVGAALAISGSVYQAMFVNPLVSPGVLGVLAGASFGAALGIVVVRHTGAGVCFRLCCGGHGCSSRITFRQVVNACANPWRDGQFGILHGA